MKLKDNKVLSDDGKIIAEKERGYGDWISKDDSVSISDILEFINGPVIEETEMIRARNNKGHYIADDPTTPENEAWSTKVIKKLVKKT
jgi:hypothetical protein|tara:strand:+ start:455 stop:718 length:264 start_codon:yes stop_codon:yes gene_type:complete